MGTPKWSTTMSLQQLHHSLCHGTHCPATRLFQLLTRLGMTPNFSHHIFFLHLYKRQHRPHTQSSPFALSMFFLWGTDSAAPFLAPQVSSSHDTSPLPQPPQQPHTTAAFHLHSSFSNPRRPKQTQSRQVLSALSYKFTWISPADVHLAPPAWCPPFCRAPSC